MRTTLLELLSGQRVSPPPAFSGLIQITAEGLREAGLAFEDVHHDAVQMARAAASTYRLTGLPSATLPLDLCAPAEALGQELKFYGSDSALFPQPARPLFGSTRDLDDAFLANPDLVNRGRLPLICEALQQLRAEVGQEIVISGLLPGPYTLLLYLVEPGSLFTEMKREPQAVQDAVFGLAGFLAQVGRSYRAAGADFITIHDMGGSPGFLGPAKYEQFVWPAENHLIAQLPVPRVLSICGNVTRSLSQLNAVGAEAISIDHTTPLDLARPSLQTPLLFGNLDPVTTLWHAEPVQISDVVQEVRAAGVDAVWPGCDLALQVPLKNLQALAGPASP